MNVRNTTLCYIKKDDQYLMLLRNKKANDLNKGKWIGVGGKLEEGESPDECLIREVKEETGLLLTSYQFRGVITFVSDEWGIEYMFLYTADGYKGELIKNEEGLYLCNEGTLKWVQKDEIMNLNLWEGDRLFLKPMMDKEDLIFMKLVYKGDKLVEIIDVGHR